MWGLEVGSKLIQVSGWNGFMTFIMSRAGVCGPQDGRSRRIWAFGWKKVMGLRMAGFSEPLKYCKGKSWWALG